jgi:hypothetical protein
MLSIEKIKTTKFYIIDSTGSFQSEGVHIEYGVPNEDNPITNSRALQTLANSEDFDGYYLAFCGFSDDEIATLQEQKSSVIGSDREAIEQQVTRIHFETLGFETLDEYLQYLELVTHLSQPNPFTLPN